MAALAAPLFVVVSIAWLALLLAAPFLPAAVAGVTYAFCSLICHQIPERSFHVGAVQLPVCARCIGIYAGVVVGALVQVSRRPPTKVVRTLFVPGALPTVVTVAAEWVGWWQTSNSVRFAAGLPLGIAGGLVVAAALATLHCDECAPRPPIASSRPPSPI